MAKTTVTKSKRNETLNLKFDGLTRGEAVALLNALHNYAPASPVSADLEMYVRTAYEEAELHDLICD
jgi:hypothetical protein